MEKERVFRERFVQAKSSQGSDGSMRQHKSMGSGTAILGLPDSSKVDLENMPLSH